MQKFRNGDEIPDGTLLSPGQLALIVSPGFDWGASAAGGPVEGVLLVVLGGSIGSNGLKNSEAETVELYAADGNLVSRYDASLGAPIEGIGIQRVDPVLPDGDPLAFAPDPMSSSTPGTIN